MAALLLAACATCSEVPVLQPRTIEPGRFEPTVDAGNDALFLEGKDIALWLTPCPRRQSGPLRGSLCGRLIVAPGVRFLFDGAVARLRFVAGPGREVSIRPVDFKLNEAEIGCDCLPASTSLFINRPYRLPGTWLLFRIFAPDDVKEDAWVSLPSATVDSRPVVFPPFRVTPAIGESCVHAH